MTFITTMPRRLESKKIIKTSRDEYRVCAVDKKESFKASNPFTTGEPEVSIRMADKTSATNIMSRHDHKSDSE